jgi:hypothetical protein
LETFVKNNLSADKLMVFNLSALVVCKLASRRLAAAFQVPGNRSVALGFAARNHVRVFWVNRALAFYDD